MLLMLYVVICSEMINDCKVNFQVEQVGGIVCVCACAHVGGWAVFNKQAAQCV